ncbi:MAG: hypothetical protein KKD63_07145 [Proteobacteria bacterium]|nr:hypothetical protein [Desulfobulbaceae bacterium]MBU4152639.1 hypothetical protein [Pseudomonadota bacterium]
MHSSVNDVLTYEVKQEIANRYFGFRKLIEEDTMALADKIRHYAVILEKRIVFDLIRVFILIKDETLIEKFMALADIPEESFYDPYLIQSQTIRKRVFEGVRFRGLTKKGCFSNAIIDCYERLIDHVERYREQFAELVASQQMISDEIDLFYRKNDLGSILGFLRGLGDPASSSVMKGGLEQDLAMDLDRKLRISPPVPIDHILPVLSPLPPLSVIRREMNAIISQSYSLQGQDIHDYLSDKTFFARYSW